jgi:branched-chain amino acid transport system substrate-binding protein
MQVIAQAMAQSHSQDGKVLATWLHQHPVHTVLGDLSWNSQGDLENAAYIIYQWDNKGNYQPLKS